jgi:hypothetical protein
VSTEAPVHLNTEVPTNVKDNKKNITLGNNSY